MRRERKEYMKQYHKRWYQANKIKRNLQIKQGYLDNIEKRRESSRKNYLKNRIKRLDKVRNNKYGISPESYWSLHAQQEGLCAICHNPCTCGRTLAVDHDHNTGIVRGLLCSRCNRGIGLFKESPEYLESAKNYLIKQAVVIK